MKCTRCDKYPARPDDEECFACHVKGLTFAVPMYMRATYDTDEARSNAEQIKRQVAADPDRYSNKRWV